MPPPMIRTGTCVWETMVRGIWCKDRNCVKGNKDEDYFSSNCEMWLQATELLLIQP
jgi:hypothetical protein